MVVVTSVCVTAGAIKVVLEPDERIRIHRLAVPIIATVRNCAATVARNRTAVERVATTEESSEPVHS